MSDLRLKYKKLITANFLLVLALIPGQALAGCTDQILPCGDLNGDGEVSGSEMCTLCSIFELVSNILMFILTCLTPAIAGLLLVVGGFYFLTAGGDPSKINQARNIIFAVVVGVVIVFIAWVALNTFLESIGAADWTGLKEGWWKIDCVN